MLLGGNNRMIAVAVASFAQVGRAVAGAERARQIAASAGITYTVADDRLWYWRLHDDGKAVAVSASGFARRLDAQRAARRFTRTASTADVQLGVVTVPDRVRERPGDRVFRGAARRFGVTVLLPAPGWGALAEAT